MDNCWGRSIVNGLRDDDTESFYGSRTSFASEYSVREPNGSNNDGMQVFVKEHGAKGGGNPTFLSRKKSQTKSRPETKVGISFWGGGWCVLNWWQGFLQFVCADRASDRESITRNGSRVIQLLTWRSPSCFLRSLWGVALDGRRTTGSHAALYGKQLKLLFLISDIYHCSFGPNLDNILPCPYCNILDNGGSEVFNMYVCRDCSVIHKYPWT